jgi:hypothetical protein
MGLGLMNPFEVLQFCHENYVIPGQLPSHTSHGLQPCDVVVFGPLTTAYRDRVEGNCTAQVQTL